MSAPVATPPRAPEAGADAQAPPPAAPSADRLVLPLVALIIAACLPLTRVYIGLGFLRPVLAAALLSLGVSWVARRLGSGPVTALLASVLAWAVFTTLAFLPDTAAYGILPTRETLAGGRDLWFQAFEVIRSRPAPAYPEAGLLLLTATGVWWTAHAVDVLLFRLQAPLRAIGMALVLWTVPLALHRGDAVAWLWAAPLLVAAAWLLLAAGGGDVQRFGRRVHGRAGSRVGRAHHVRSGAVVAGAAIVVGALLAGWLPGFGEPPYYRLPRLGAGSTLTTNPIVTIRDNLVRAGPDPVAQVETTQPVYLRLTSLDRYDASEQWRADGISGGPVRGTLPFETDLPSYSELEVEVTPEGLGGAVLVPAPYQPMRVSGPAANRFYYDETNATLTLGDTPGLAAEESYTVTAALPDPDPDALSAAVGDVDPALTELPRNVPDEVVELAAEIVAAAGAETAFEQALAIQNELRSWTYSLDPPAGHSSSAMLDFIEHRVGYCEQYAGTMAVMLRALGIPARVAVGYTPGEIVEEDGDRTTYLVTRENAHAWVEVIFPGQGWISFEPTPRDDGNVLTPSATNLAPSELVADQDGLDDFDDLGELENPDELVPDVDDMPLGDAGDAAASEGGAQDGTGASGWWWLAGVLALGGAAAAAVGARLQASRRRELAERERVLVATHRVQRAGRGLGIAPQATETDREYLTRLAASAPDGPAQRAAGNGARGAGGNGARGAGGNGARPIDGNSAHASARTLAAAAARARYAPAVTAGVAREAETAAARLLKMLLDRQPAWRRAVVGVRGAASEALRTVSRSTR